MSAAAPTSIGLLTEHAPDQAVAFGGAGRREARELLADVAALAASLPEPSDSSHVAVIAEDRYLLAASVLAAWQRGHAVALPPNGRPETIAALLARPDVITLLHDSDAPPRPDAVDVRAALAAAPPAVVSAALNPLAAERPAATVFTSGSTGDVVACPKTAGQLLGEAMMLADRFGVGRDTRVVPSVPPHHIYGLLFGVLVPLARGGAFCRDTPLHAEAVAARVADHGATWLVSVPAHLRGLAALDPASPRLASLTRVVSSAAPLPARTATMLRERFDLEVTEVLGSSETGGIAWRDRGQSELWEPLPQVTVAADAAGQLLVDSPFIDPAGGRPAVTADRVALAEGGRFRHLGRADGVVKVAGKRVAIAEVNARLLALPGVADAACAAIEVGGARGHELVAAVVGAGWTPAALRQALSGWLEPAQAPRRFRVVGALPREANGKLTRARLLALFDAPDRPSTELVVLSRDQTEDEGALSVDVVFHVPADLVWFRGHFPALPLLPGVVQLHDVVLAEARRAMSRLKSPRRLSRVKFRRPISPGDDLHARLVFDDRGDRGLRVSFSLEVDGAQCASGAMEFAAEPST